MPQNFTRSCPTCGARIDLRRCDIVATRGTGSAIPASGGFDNLDSPEVADETHDPDLNSGYPVIFKGTGDEVEREVSALTQIFGSRQPPMTPLSTAPSHRIPRRLCEVCAAVLPVDLDERDCTILAVVGLNGAGKTHFLAAALTEATRRGGLRRFGCEEFAPVDGTAATLHSRYDLPVFRHGRLLGATQVHEPPEPLGFRMTFRGSEPLLLLTHDVSGEALIDHDRRATDLSFLRRADAVIFLLDPLEFDTVRRKVPKHLLPVDRSIHQVDLLRACMRELEETSERPVPLCVTIAKTDLLTDYCGATGRWLEEPTTDWVDDIKAVGADVKKLLIDLDEEELISAVQGQRRVAWHAVSVLRSADHGQLVPQPQRCTDPLGVALYGMTR